MKRKLIRNLVTATAVLFCIQGFAQTGETGDSKHTRFGIGLSLGVPTTSGYDLALGGDLRVQKDFSSNVSGTLSAGYTNFSFKEPLDGGIGFIPVKVGIKVFPVESFYFSGELGAGFGTDSGQKTAFVYAPGIGYGFNNGIDLGLRYEGFAVNNATLSQVALRIAYGFNLTK